MYICTTSLPVICRWTFRLLLCPGYCKYCCSEHWGTCVFLSYNFLRVYNQQWDCSKAEPGRIRKYKRPIVSNEIETVVKNLPTYKSPAPGDFPGKFCQTLIEELTHPFKTFPKYCKRRSTPKFVLQAHRHPDN